MDSFHGSPPRQIPDGWTEFLIYGDATFFQDDHTYFGGPNLTIANNGGTFKAGIYTQVGVTPGAGYRASISWGAPNAPATFGRQLGIDPTGGTDPNSPRCHLGANALGRWAHSQLSAPRCKYRCAGAGAYGYDDGLFYHRSPRKHGR